MNTISFLKYNNFIMGLGPQGKIYFHKSLEEEKLVRPRRGKVLHRCRHFVKMSLHQIISYE